MRFLNWYSLSICLIVTIFVAMIASLFLRDSNICIVCLVSKKAADCEQFKKGIEATSKEVGGTIRSTVELYPQKTKQSYITILNSWAKTEEKEAQFWESLQMQEPKSKLIQSLLVQGSKLRAEGHRDYAKTIELQPGNVQLTILEFVIPPNQATDEAQTKSKEAKRELDKYCPNLLEAKPSTKPNATVSTP